MESTNSHKCENVQFYSVNALQFRLSQITSCICDKTVNLVANLMQLFLKLKKWKKQTNKKKMFIPSSTVNNIIDTVLKFKRIVSNIVALYSQCLHFFLTSRNIISYLFGNNLHK